MNELLEPMCSATYNTLHDIGISWSYLAEKLGYDIRTLKRRKDDVVFTNAGTFPLNWVEATMRQCDDLVNGYIEIRSNAQKIKDQWEQIRKPFEEDLKFFYGMKTMDGGQTFHRLDEFAQNQSDRKKDLLKQIKPVFDSLSIKKSLVYCFDSYVRLLDCALFPYVHFLSGEKKNAILEEMYQLTCTGKDMINGLCFGIASAHPIAELLNYGGRYDRGGDTELWHRFQKKMKNLGYEYCRSMAAALRCEMIQSIERTELLIYYGYMLGYDVRSMRMDGLIPKVKSMLSKDAHMKINEYQRLKK